MNPWAEAGWWTLLAAGLLGTALFSGLETGLYFINRVKLEVRAAHGPRRRGARILRRELEHPERLLATNLIGTILFSDLAAAGASELLHGWGYTDLAAIAVNVLVLTPLLFVFAETVPKEMFRLEADGLTYVFGPFLAATRAGLTRIGVLPLVRLLVGGATRIIGGEGEAGLALSSRERIATMIKDSAGSGALSESQAGLVDRALAFERMTLADAMTPWQEVRTIPGDWARDQVVRLLSRERRGLLPVVARGAPGQVVGVLRFEDGFLRAAPNAAALAREPARLPVRMSLPEAAARIRESDAGAAIVEEGGRTVGFASLADVLEPLIRG